MRQIYPVAAAIFAVVLVALVYARAGLPGFVIFGSATSIAYVLWLLTTYRRPADPQRIVPLYLVALAAQVLHTMEEYVTDFPGELAALFGTAPLGIDTFVVAVMGAGAAIWILTAVGCSTATRSPIICCGSSSSALASLIRSPTSRFRSSVGCRISPASLR